MIAPARPLCVIMGGVAVLTLALYAFPSGWPIFVMLNLSIATLAAWDLLTLPTRRELSARRTLGHVATRGETHPIFLTIENRSRRPFVGLVRDDQPPGLTGDQNEFPIQIPSQSRAAVHYTLIPRHRGRFELVHVSLKTDSRWMLWQRYFRLPCRDALRVYPALKQIRRYAMYARLNRTSMLGVRRQRRIGTDNEFERLRDYTPDDQFRVIDWRATGRRLKLTVRDFQMNQSQRVVFMIDCGRMMVNQFDGQSLLDAAFDAALTLGYVTLAQNDQVGLLCFSDRVLRWLPPQSGRRQLNRMVHAVHDIAPALVESRFDEAFLHLHRNCRKRTLVVLITNVIDDQNARRMKAHVATLVGRHLPLTVLLRDHELFDPLQGVDPEADTIKQDKGVLYRAAAAADILCWRRQVLSDLQRSGALTLDCFPEGLTAPLITEYMRIKGRHLL
ncbi:DUF58 domain-containing protein [Schlesneria paludicola]|uniref:DUF58 domain-containing protein n=1 Tax=Schlesneria paludicola TaxID=360056 RepID=UPI00029AC08E|nr:DUF58 domain-containing protein [Schlesneria paludicola]